VLNPFARSRFGRPQLIAIAFLLVFLAQALYVVDRQPLAGAELGYIQTGEQRLRGSAGAAPHFVSPLIAITAALPVVALGKTGLTLDETELDPLRWPARLPFVFVGLLLGGSLWYVTRRLYGNLGGYVALALYTFSSAPAISARVGPNIVAMLGVFGIIYVSIALAHTFYASDAGFLRECWPRWKRVLLLAAALLLALGAAPATALLLPLALAFMYYLLPSRKRWWLPLGVIAVTTSLALLALFALAGFHLAALAQQLSLSVGVVSWQVASAWIARYFASALWLTHYPALAIFLLLALAAYLGARRVRYFGNTAPLLVLVAAWLLAVAGLAPDTLAYGAFPLRVLLFVFVFFAGVAADLLEMRARTVLAPLLAALLLSHATIGLLDLKRTGGSTHPFRVESVK
jgi:hypothetical protein